MKKDDNVTILVVDDSEDNLKVAGVIFKDLGYKLAFAACGQDALEIVGSNPVSLILLDIMMPGMDGFEVCHLLKSNPKTKDIPIIFLSGKADTEDIVTGFLLGGSDYIIKPFRKEELICRVNNHLDLIKARKIIVHQQNELMKLQKFSGRLAFNFRRIFQRIME